ncbi:hypothetical protein LMIY3S_03670 [Labrys miyagiensis]
MAADNFDWNDREVIAVPEQQAIAVYTNPHHQVVLRFHDADEQEDRWVVIAPEHVDRLCKALQVEAAHAMKQKEANDNE